MPLLRQTTLRLRPNQSHLLLSSPKISRPILKPQTPCSGRRNFSIASTVGATTDALTWAHVDLGMPWYVVIPLLALGVNVTMRFPLQYYAAHLREKRKSLNPLLMAWGQKHGAAITREQGHQLPERILNLRIASAIERSKARIYKNWGVQRWKGFAPLLSIIPFLTVSEALRRKCGAPMGWFSQTIGLSNASSANMLDPSLTNGGCLWFTDLTAVDPYMGLPLICSGILMLNFWGKMPKERVMALLSIKPSDPSKQVTLNRLQKLLGRTLLIVPITPLLLTDLPSALFLYWVSSFALTTVNQEIIDRIVPKGQARLNIELKRNAHIEHLKNSIATPVQSKKA